ARDAGWGDRRRAARARRALRPGLRDHRGRRRRLPDPDAGRRPGAPGAPRAIARPAHVPQDVPPPRPGLPQLLPRARDPGARHHGDLFGLPLLPVLPQGHPARAGPADPDVVPDRHHHRGRRAHQPGRPRALRPAWPQAAGLPERRPDGARLGHLRRRRVLPLAAVHVRGRGALRPGIRRLSGRGLGAGDRRPAEGRRLRQGHGHLARLARAAAGPGAGDYRAHPQCAQALGAAAGLHRGVRDDGGLVRARHGLRARDPRGAVGKPITPGALARARAPIALRPPSRLTPSLPASIFARHAPRPPPPLARRRPGAPDPRRRSVREPRAPAGAGAALPAALDRRLRPADLGDHGAHRLARREGRAVRGREPRSSRPGCSPMNPALLIIALFLAFAFVLGLLARRGRTMTLEQWAVGGRGFGALLVFLLMAGEIYTTFTFLGGSGWAYGRG